MDAFVGSELLHYEVRNRTCYITMNRPAVLNALSSQLRRDLDAAFLTYRADDSLLVAVLGGEGGRSFSSGADVKELAQQLADERSTGNIQPIARLGGMPGFDALYECPKPVIAAIDGYCIGGGLELALYCDIRVATRQSTFGLPEPKISRLGGPGLHNLSRMVPLGEALKMQLTGGTIDAERAYQIGLVQELVVERSELAEKVEELTSEIAACAPRAVRAIKRIVKTGRNLPVEYSWYLAEGYAESITRSEDALEGAAAFAEKRPPRWK